MARKTFPLSDTQIRSSKPKSKDYKLTDGAGLYLLVKTTGSKWWRFNYRFDGKEQTISLGIYPDVSLQFARQQRDELRSKVVSGINPSAERKKIKTIQKLKKEKELGLNMTQAITLFLQQVKLQRGLPFEVKLPSDTTVQALKELETRDGKKFASIDELFDNLEN